MVTKEGTERGPGDKSRKSPKDLHDDGVWKVGNLDDEGDDL